MSGRTVEDLGRFGFPEHVEIFGLHGMERRAERSVELADHEEARLQRLLALAADAADRAGDGAWVEVKPASVVLHVREAHPDHGPRSADELQRQAEDVTGAHVLPGHGVVELMTRATSKAMAVAELRDELAVAAAAFVGDDRTDEEVFTAMGAGDCPIRVGAGATAARYRLPALPRCSPSFGPDHPPLTDPSAWRRESPAADTRTGANTRIDERSVRWIGRALPTLRRWTRCARSAGSASRAAGSSPTSTTAQLVKLTPDREHPVTKGFACHKGLAAVDVHHDPDRLDHPQLRAADGTWTTVGVGRGDGPHGRPAAGDRRRARARTRSAPTSATRRRSTRSPRCTSRTLLRALGVRRTFSSGTQDCANKFVASEAVFGTSTVHPIPDLEHTDLCLVIGENPRASQASFYSIPNVLGELRRATARGARIVFVNPRRIETPERGVGDTVLIRPDTDVWFLAALLHEIDAPRRLRRPASSPATARHVDELRAFLAAVPAGPTSPRHRHRRRRGPRAGRGVGRHAAGVGRTRRPGINMGRQGSLAYWLVHMLSFVTGRLDVEGGNLKSDGFYANARVRRRRRPSRATSTPSSGGCGGARCPGTLMADAILDSAEPVRAMIVVAGNPLLSIAGEERLRKAFEQLELLVVIDIYPSATAELADVVLPCTDMYERDDLNIVNIGTSARPFAQYTPAVVAPAHERRPEWWIAHRLLQELGEPSLLDDERPGPVGEVAAHAAARRRRRARRPAGDRRRPSCCRRRRRASSSTSRCGPTTAGSTAARRRSPAPSTAAATCSPRSSCANADAAAADPRPRPVDAQHVVRQPAAHEAAAAARRTRCASTPPMPPRSGSPTATGSSSPATTARSPPTSPLDDELMPGVVSMVHGWGHAASPGLRVAAEHPGTNPNVLLPSGPGSYEPLSSQAHMTGIPVTVRKA